MTTAFLIQQNQAFVCCIEEDLNNDEIEEMLKALIVNTSVTEVDFEGVHHALLLMCLGHPLTDLHVQLLCQVLEKNETLNSLRFWNTPFASDKLDIVLNALEKNTGIYDFQVTAIPMSTNSIAHLSQVLQNHPTITSLQLNNVGLNDDGIEVLVPGLQKIHNLSVMWNEIGDRGMETLTACDCFKNLQTISMLGNEITDVGALLFASALKENQTLREIDLHDNLIPRDAADALWKVVNEKEYSIIFDIDHPELKKKKK